MTHGHVVETQELDEMQGALQEQAEKHTRDSRVHQQEKEKHSTASQIGSQGLSESLDRTTNLSGKVSTNRFQYMFRLNR